MMFGVYSTEGAEVGGADTLLNLLEGNCLLGDIGEDRGDDSEGVPDLLRCAGLFIKVFVFWSSTISSSGNGPRSDPPLTYSDFDRAEFFFSLEDSPLFISEFCIAAYAAFCVGTWKKSRNEYH